MSAATLPPRSEPMTMACYRGQHGDCNNNRCGCVCHKPPPSGGQDRTLEERRAEYEWDGAPRGVCVVCGKFYEENVEHEGKDAPFSVPEHRFKTAPSGGQGEPDEGWGVITGRKAHYYRRTFSLCRKRGFYTGPLDPDNGKPSVDDCAECRRRLDAEKRHKRPPSGGAVDDGATPRPWRTPSAHDSEFVADGTAMPVVLDSDGALIADCDIFCLHGGAAPTEAEMTANAALIVAAVNSHGPLLAACKGEFHDGPGQLHAYQWLRSLIRWIRDTKAVTDAIAQDDDPEAVWEHIRTCEQMAAALAEAVQGGRPAGRVSDGQ